MKRLKQLFGLDNEPGEVELSTGDNIASNMRPEDEGKIIVEPQ